MQCWIVSKIYIWNWELFEVFVKQISATVMPPKTADRKNLRLPKFVRPHKCPRRQPRHANETRPAAAAFYTFIGESQQTTGRPLALTMRSSYCGYDHSNELPSPYPKGLDWNPCPCTKATAVNQSGFHFISYFKKKANKFNSTLWHFFDFVTVGKNESLL